MGIYCLRIIRDVNISDEAKRHFLNTDAYYIYNLNKMKTFYGKDPCFREGQYYGLLNSIQKHRIVDDYNRKNRMKETVSTFFYISYF